MLNLRIRDKRICGKKKKKFIPHHDKVVVGVLMRILLHASGEALHKRKKNEMRGGRQKKIEGRSKKKRFETPHL